MDESPITMSKGLSAVIPKDNDGYCTVYKMDCADGLGLMTVYQVYPGIQLIDEYRKHFPLFLRNKMKTSRNKNPLSAGSLGTV